MESEQTLHFLQTSSRHNMVQIDAHTYILGQSKLVATPDQKDLLNTGRIEVSWRLYKQGHLYTSRSYFRGLQGKRNNTVCVFKTGSNMRSYGETDTFVNSSPPQAIIRVHKAERQLILQQAGPPCRCALAINKEVDLLDNYITRVARNGPLVQFPSRTYQKLC